MKEMARYGFILGLICTVAAGLLAGANSLTKSRIIAQALAEEHAGLKEVMPQGARFLAEPPEGEVAYYKVFDDQDRFIGAAFKVQAKGYSSTVLTMAGLLKDGTVTAIKILSQGETPGLGAKVAESDFTGQFKNKKDLNDVQAITGATISSRAVIDSVKIRAEEIKRIIESER